MIGKQLLGSGLSAAFAILLLATLPVAAAISTPYTSTGWVIGVPVPGLWYTNALGQVIERGNVHVARVDSSDPRLTGRRLIFLDGAAQTDGSLLLYGTCYQEVGTWDAAGTNFTSSGGLWEINYRGVMQIDNSLQLHLVGSGSGGNIQDWRFEEDLTRAACPGILDPIVPYVYTGTIKPPLLSTRVILNNFDDNSLMGIDIYGQGTVKLIETNQQFTVRGYWPGRVTKTLHSSFGAGAMPRSWGLTAGKTLEWRVDLIRLDETATNAAILVLGTTSGVYGFHKGRDFVSLVKYLGTGDDFARFYYEKKSVRNTNVILALALTPMRPNVILTARVLDKENPNAVLYQRTVVDTPQADPTLTRAELEALSGMRLEEVPDVPGNPPTSGGSVGLGLWQYTDGKQPTAEATFDNLELWTYEFPKLSIERAVRLSWPAPTGVNYAVEGAPTVQGPWLPIHEVLLPGMNQMTVSSNDPNQFFRLREAP